MLVFFLLFLFCTANLDANLISTQCITYQQQLRSHYVDFDHAMALTEYSAIAARSKDLYAFLKNLYNENSFLKVQVQDKLKIPKIIHQVWLGSPLPEEYKAFVQSWKDNHPDWEYILWTDEKVKEFPLINQHYYDEATNYGEKSDILKWELIYRIGGVYIDTDFECIKPLDVLHYTYDFYVGIQPLDTNIVQLGAALFAAHAGHPILKHCVETIKDDRDKKQIVLKTGPLHFTKSLFLVAGRSNNIDVALPADYFYPCSYEQRGMEPEAWLKPTSFAVHHWAGSWLKPQGFVSKKQTNNFNK